MLSACAGEESRVEGMEAGADDCLIKPFSARELQARVAAHLQMARLRREANQSIRESEERLRIALAAARMVAWQWDLADDRVTTSENAAEVLGLPHDAKIESIQQGFALIHPDDVRRHQVTLRQAVRKCRSYLSQFRLIRPDNGHILWLEERGHCVCEGEVTRLVGVVMDITRQKQAESLQTGQSHVLEMIAVDKPLPDVLTALIQTIEAQDSDLLCSVLLLDDDGRHIRSGVGPSLPEEYLQALGGLSIEPPYISPCGMAMHCQQEVIVPDTTDDPRWSPQWREMALRHGLRSCCSMPILAADGKVLGTFANYRRQPGGREPASMELLQIATHIAGIAIERKRAEAALQENRIQLASELAAMTRLHELVARLLTCPDLRTALDEVLGATVAILGANMGTVQLFNPHN